MDGRIEPALMEMNSGACYARTVASNFLMLAHVFNIRDRPRSIQHAANSTQHTYDMPHAAWVLKFGGIKNIACTET